MNLKTKIIEELALDAFKKKEHLEALQSIGRSDDPKERKRLAVALALAKAASYEADSKLTTAIYH